MNLGQLERYAPQARKDFIQAVTTKASKLGISGKNILEAKKSGDALIIGGNVFPANIDYKRKALADRVEKDGFDKVMEEVAYTWFNRFTAMRYMEIHGYIEEHPFLLFENPDGSSEPEIIKHVSDLGDWKELNFNLALDLKTQNKTEELYQLIITAQCHSLGKIIPFLFAHDAIEVELLLPEGLLLSDSITRGMIGVLNKENLSEVESLGWLYQFYISEKKNSLMKAKKAYQADEIPAVTQLFTPNWIVKYLTQNSIGRLWLSTYPESPLKEKMEYYIEPAEQTKAVNKQLEEITPKSINPEEITILDPACGSGHILVEAYDLLKEIYLERGYQEKEIPRLILEKNLHGLDIDDRAAQLARFSLLMKARQDDRRFFRSENQIDLNICSIQESNNLNIKDFEGLEINGIEDLISTFQDAKTYGSLIEIPRNLKNSIEQICSKVTKITNTENQSFDSIKAKALFPLIRQTIVMHSEYEAVITNPPYMGGNYFNSALKNHIFTNYKNEKGDLYTCFISRNINFSKHSGFIGMITIPNWMFLSSYEKVRSKILSNYCIDSLIHNGRGVWGSDFGSCSFVIRKSNLDLFQGTYKRLFEKQGSVVTNQELEKRFFTNSPFYASAIDFKKIPGSPIAYWASGQLQNIFLDNTSIAEHYPLNPGIRTGNDKAFLRLWHEVSNKHIQFSLTDSSQMNYENRWFPLHKGGNFRKWYGNIQHVIDLYQDGVEIKTKSPDFRLRDKKWYFKPHISWSRVSSGKIAFRHIGNGILFSDAGPGIFSKKKSFQLIGFLNSCLGSHFLSVINPSLNYQNENIGTIPFCHLNHSSDIQKAIDLSKSDWDAYEISWDFTTSPFLLPKNKVKTMGTTYENIRRDGKKSMHDLHQLEEENNQKIIESLGLNKELDPKVLLKEISLNCNPIFRYGNNKDESELESLLMSDTVKEFVSFILGCMMGRYSLNQPGLIYANSENKDFDKSKYKTFPVDDDGIITLTDTEELVIRDDLTDRFSEFVQVVWGEETLSENLKFMADTLGPRNNELPKETIRRWVSTELFKDHLKRYKNRPIYWLFSSGKKKAFEGLVYLHRYHEGTLSRMRMKYVIPLQSRISDRLKTIDDDIVSASSAQERNKLIRQKKLLADKELELREYDETLRHLAEQQIKLDLDDGVKVNYGKFPGLLAETKKVCGK